MTTTNNNIALVHRKEWQMMTPAPIAPTTGSFIVTDAREIDNLSLYIYNATTHYLYNHDQDSWMQIPSGALAGTFGAGATGCRSRFSNVLTANGGSTTTITTLTAINELANGKKIRFLSGLNIGREALVTGIRINLGGTNTLIFDALPNACANTDTFVVESGLFTIINAGVQAVGSVKTFDPLTFLWTTISQTGLPATISNDSRLVATPSDDVFATGTSTGINTTTTLNNSAKTWTVNQWGNYQVRITLGTGIGQTRTIASNTATAITVSAAWTITPDATSVYEITGNDDFLYYFGSNTIATYRYTRSLNTWATLAPTVARVNIPGTGMSADWAGKTNNIDFANESNIQDGKYIYSFRGNGTGSIDMLDITGVTTWKAIVYGSMTETFNTGSSYALSGFYIYIRKDSTHRYFRFNVCSLYMESLSTNLYPDSTAVLGDKIWIHNYQELGVTKLTWLYSLRNSGIELHRILLF